MLVRYNSDDPDTEMNERQLVRLKQLADWLHSTDRKFLFELLVPATDEQLASVDGDTERYDAELRPELMRRAIEDTQNAGIEVDVWKIEGVDEQSDAAMLAEQARSGPGREGVTCVLLGRGASTEKVEQWLQQAAPVEGFIGFAIGRSIWWDALKGFLDKELERKPPRQQIAENYLHFVKVYERQTVHWPPVDGGAVYLQLHNDWPSELGRLARHGDEDAPESRGARAGVPARDAAGPAPRQTTVAAGQLAHAQAQRERASASAARCASGCSSSR